MSKRNNDIILGYLDISRPVVSYTESIEDIAKAAIVNSVINGLSEFIKILQEGKIPPETIKVYLERVN